METKVPFVDLKAQYQRISKDPLYGARLWCPCCAKEEPAASGAPRCCCAWRNRKMWLL